MTKPLNQIEAFKALKKIVALRRANVLNLMPQYAPRTSTQIVADMLTPGTNAHALMTAICMVIAHELSFRANQVDVDNDWIGG